MRPAALQQPQNWVRSYYPAFDGLRAVAVLAVFYSHYCEIADPALHRWWTWSGVDLFFVLSGFLITGILFDTRQRPRYFRDFYVRRSLRIFPLYYGFFLLIAVVTPFGILHYNKWLAVNLLYLLNVATPGAVLGQHGNPTMVSVSLMGKTWSLLLGPWWSLCVEEHFYLVWPLIVWLLPDRKTLLRVCVTGILLTAVLRTYLFFHLSPRLVATGILYFSSYTRCDTLLVGAAIALWLRGGAQTRRTVHGVAWAAIGGSLTALVFLLARFNHEQVYTIFNPVLLTVGYTLVAFIAGGVLLFSMDESTLLHRVMRHRWLVWLGRISYGFYFFHGLPQDILSHVGEKLAPHHLRFLVFPIAFCFALGMAALSFRFWESPFLRLKDRLAPVHPSVPTGREEGPDPTLTLSSGS